MLIFVHLHNKIHPQLIGSNPSEIYGNILATKRLGVCDCTHFLCLYVIKARGRKLIKNKKLFAKSFNYNLFQMPYIQRVLNDFKKKSIPV